FCRTAIPMWPGIPTAPTAGSAPICRRSNLSRSRGLSSKTRSKRLFDFLLDGAAERKQALIECGRHLADEFDHAAAVLEDARLPDQLIAEFVDLRLVGRLRILQRLQGNRIGADLVRGRALLARHPLEPAHDRRAFGIEPLEQSGEHQLARR